MLWLLVTLLASSWQFINACNVLEVVGRAYGSLMFHQIEIDSPLLQNLFNSGRPSYVSHGNDGETLYLYHISFASGEGRWVINDVLGETDRARSYITSWAILPFYVPFTHDELSSKEWMTPFPPDYSWEIDDSLSIACAAGALDRTVFFDSSKKYVNKLSGYYVERLISSNHEHRGPIYSQIKFYDTPSHYMYIIGDEASGYHWLISNEIGADAGLAMARYSSLFADEVTSEWLFATDDPESPWNLDIDASIISSFLFDSRRGYTDAVTPLPQALHQMRSIRKIPSQGYYQMRNGVPIPAVGLGTGGILREESKEVFTTALSIGYQLFDLAREYGNEHIMGYILDNHGLVSDERFLRKNNFFETKVWPTNLGFIPTTREIYVSMAELFTNYIDLYLLHWPECYSNISWMHCEDTEEPQSTWRESWRALEKAYSEGFIMSIGVSNFNVALLDEMLEFGAILPHVVQNFADLGNLDSVVRNWCNDHHIIYQPYASIRNLVAMDDEIRKIAQDVATRHSISEHTVSLKFFLQSGASIIPRSTNIVHLKENLALHSWNLSIEEMENLGSNKLSAKSFHDVDEEL